MIRLFARPKPIQVTADSSGVPQGIYWGDRWRTVAPVDALREYFKLATADGLLCTAYRDLVDDAWYLDRIYNRSP